MNTCFGKVNLYEAGRSARVAGVKISDCLYTPNTRQHQEWAIGWLDEDLELIAAKPVVDADFTEWN